MSRTPGIPGDLGAWLGGGDGGRVAAVGLQVAEGEFWEKASISQHEAGAADGQDRCPEMAAAQPRGGRRINNPPRDTIPLPQFGTREIRRGTRRNEY